METGRTDGIPNLRSTWRSKQDDSMNESGHNSAALLLSSRFVNTKQPLPRLL